MKDIRSREDIDMLMVAFYDAAFADESIGYIFTDVANMDLEEHLPVIGGFGRALFSAVVFTQNAGETRWSYIINCRKSRRFCLNTLTDGLRSSRGSWMKTSRAKDQNL